jgi:ribonuclease HI
VTCLHRPWNRRNPIRFAKAEANREEPPTVRRERALVLLDSLRKDDPPFLQIWTDGAAEGGLKNGGGGFILRHQAVGPDTKGSVPAGRWTSSTSAEATAAAAGLEAAQETLRGRPGKSVWLLFDSLALFQRLQSPTRCLEDHATAQAALLLQQLAATHRLTVIWVPGHAGLTLNEAADQLARRGCALPQDPAPVPAAAARAAIRRQGRTEDTAEYNRLVPEDHPHRKCGGTPLPTRRDWPREIEVALFQLRANRAPFLQATQHRWGRAPSAACPHCDAPVEDTRHFICDCPRWAAERRRFLPGAVPGSMSPLQEDLEGVRTFVEATGALARPQYA